MKLTFCIPTCEPKTIRKLLLPSLIYLKPIKELFKLCICFQPPYSEEDINKVCSFLDKLEFNYSWFYKDYDIKNNEIPIIRMRQDCSLLEPDSDYYALLDDDMEFKENTYEWYLKALNDLDSDNNIGVISLHRDRNNGIECELTKYNQNCYATDNGLIYRGGKFYGFEGMYPEKLNLLPNIKTLIPYENENLLNLVGGHEDKFGAIIRLATGQRGKIYYEVNAVHEKNRPKIGLHHDKFFYKDLQDKSICGFIRKYFIKKYDLLNCSKCFDDELLKQIYNLS